MSGGPGDENLDSYWRSAEGNQRWERYLEVYAKNYDLYSTYKLNDRIDAFAQIPPKRKPGSVAQTAFWMEKSKEIPVLLDYRYVWRIRNKKWRDNHSFDMRAIISYCIVEKIRILDVLLDESNNISDADPTEVPQLSPGVPAVIPRPAEDPPPSPPQRRWYSFILDLFRWLFGQRQ